MYRVIQIYNKTNNAILVDEKYGEDEVTLKWDGCVDFQHNGKSIHICNINEVINKLTYLKEYGEKHFSNEFWI